MKSSYECRQCKANNTIFSKKIYSTRNKEVSQDHFKEMNKTDTHMLQIIGDKNISALICRSEAIANLFLVF